MNEDIKAFLENFIQNCESSERLDSVQTAYFCNWAKSLLGKEITPLPADKNIRGFKFTSWKPENLDVPNIEEI